MSMAVVAGAGLALVAAMLATVLLLLRGPLDDTMAELCGDRSRGIFWSRLLMLALGLGTVLGVLAGAWLGRALDAATAPIAGIATLLRWGLVAELFGLAVAGLAVRRFTIRLASHTPPPPAVATQQHGQRGPIRRQRGS